MSINMSIDNANVGNIESCFTIDLEGIDILAPSPSDKYNYATDDDNTNVTLGTVTEQIEDPEPLVDYVDDDPTEDSKWQHKYNNFKIILVKENPVEKMLMKIYKEEMKHIEQVVFQKTNNGSLKDILNIFIAPLIPIIIHAVNNTTNKNKEKIGMEEAIHFVQCIMAFSIYQVTPTFMFQAQHLFPLASKLNISKLKKVLSGLSRKQISFADTSEIRWHRPFSEDQTIRDGEEAMYKINRQFFIPDMSIISVDDDHLRLSASHCETIGLPRKNNPDKAFGPVSTGAVSLTSGITLATRLAGRGENDVTTVQILFKNLFNKEIPNQVKATNLIALDRGYLSRSLIDYISATGCSIIGTHKRGMSYPFTFGEQNNIGNRVKISDEGAKMTYWAKLKSKDTQKVYKALAYRSGQGRVATMFTTSPEVNEGKFVYKLKQNCDIPKIPPVIRNHMNYTVKELTYGQGGTEWHIVRAGLGLVTSSVASSFFKLAINLQKELDDIDNLIMNGLGIQIDKGQLAEIPETHKYSEHDLIIMNRNELKEICLKYGYSRNGNKNDLVRRILEKQELPVTNAFDDDIIKSKLMKIWFMKPVKNSTDIKMGKVCEPLIASKLCFALNNDRFKIYDITEVGLVRSTSSEYLATSVDRLAIIEIKKENATMYTLDNDDDEFCQYITTIEIKCMTKNETKNAAIERIQQFESTFMNCTFGDNVFMELVWTPEYRNQCLHHVSTYTLNHLLFVVGSSTEIIYVCLIKFPDTVIMKYKEIINDFGDSYIRWYQTEENLDDTLKRIELHHAVDSYTVQFWRSMAKTNVILNNDERTRMTPAHEIVPHAVCLWNRCKGGQDVVSRQLKNVQIDFRQMKPRTYILIRQIMTQLLNAHLVYRIINHLGKEVDGVNDDDLDYDKLKGKLNEFSTFRNTLSEMFECCVTDSFNYVDIPEKNLNDNNSDNNDNEDIASIKIPRRNRLEFFNKAEGKKGD